MLFKSALTLLSFTLVFSLKELVPETVREGARRCTTTTAKVKKSLSDEKYSGCKVVGVNALPSFDGSSYREYPIPAETSPVYTDIAITFKPQSPDGVLLYGGQKADGTGDFISLSLVDGFLELRFDLGTGKATIRSEKKVEMNKWCTVTVKRKGRNAILQIEDSSGVQFPVAGRPPGYFFQLALGPTFFLGGVPDVKKTAKKAGIKSSFTGCVQKLIVNDRKVRLDKDLVNSVNVRECNHTCWDKPCGSRGICVAEGDSHNCRCHLAYIGPRCRKILETEIPKFTGHGYIKYRREEIMKRIRGNKVNIKLRFRTLHANGLILWAGNCSQRCTDFLALGIQDGYVRLQYNLGSGEVTIKENTRRVDDGLWHAVHATRQRREGFLHVDDSPISKGKSPGKYYQLNTGSTLYIGGVQEPWPVTKKRYMTGFIGCMTNLTLATDYQVHLIDHASDGLDILQCA